MQFEALARRLVEHNITPKPGGSFDTSYIALKLRAALYNGIFNGDAVPQFTPVCPTGNCTWAPVSSLAFCSTCDNFAAHSPLNCNKTNSGGAYGNGLIIRTCTISEALPGFTAIYVYLNGGLDTYPLLQVLSIQPTNDLELVPENITIVGMRNPWAAFAILSFEENLDRDMANLKVCALYP